jgi:hypothetical protein
MSSVQSSNLAQQLQNYMKLEDELQEISNRQKELRSLKQGLQKDIIETMKKHQLDNRTIKLNGRQISMTAKKQYTGITFQYLDKTLTELIPDKTQKEYVIKYLRENRETKIMDEIKIV